MLLDEEAKHNSNPNNFADGVPLQVLEKSDHALDNQLLQDSAVEMDKKLE